MNHMYALHASFLLLSFAFDRLNLRKVYAPMMDYAKAVEHLVRKAGFKKEAVLQECYFHSGIYHDFILYGILVEEFRNFQTSKFGKWYIKRIGYEYYSK